MVSWWLPSRDWPQVEQLEEEPSLPPVAAMPPADAWPAAEAAVTNPLASMSCKRAPHPRSGEGVAGERVDRVAAAEWERSPVASAIRAEIICRKWKLFRF